VRSNEPAAHLPSRPPASRAASNQQLETRNLPFILLRKIPRIMLGQSAGKKRGRMKLRILIPCILGLALAFTAAADTLRLTNGPVSYGQFVTRTPQGV
jgi:hypothetical protein